MKNYSLKFCIALDEKCAEKIERLAKKEDISRSAVMRELILQHKGNLEIPYNRRREYPAFFNAPRRKG